MKNGIEDIFKQSLEGHEVSSNVDAAWSAMKAKLDAAMPVSVSLENAMKESLGGHEEPYNPEAWSNLASRLDVIMPAAGSLAAVVKESLEGHEEAYKAEAWNQMETRLDEVMPVKPSSGWKYFVAASVVAFGVASYFAYQHYNSNPEEVVPNKTNTEIAENDSKNLNSTNSTNSNSNTSNNNVSQSNQNVNNSNSNDNHIVNVDGVENHTQQNPNGNQNTSNPTGVDPNVNQTSNNPNSNTNNPTGTNNSIGTNPTNSGSEVMMIVPIIGDMCQFDTHGLHNANEKAITVLLPNGTDYMIDAKQTVQFKAMLSGLHRIGYMKAGTFQDLGSFMVHEAPTGVVNVNRDFSYTDGLPTTEMTISTDATDIVWTANNQRQTGDKAVFHFYNKGSHKVNVELSSGTCTSTLTEPIRIDEEYNLMAMNSFNPNSPHPRNITFMPRALMERDVKFTLTILDPRDGGIAYQTSDASQGWDGVDIRSGRASAITTTYVWRVILENSEPGERAEYQGTVTKL